MSLCLMEDMGRRNKREKVRRPALKQICLIDTFGAKSEIMMKNDVLMPAGHTVNGSYQQSQFYKNKPVAKSASLILYLNKLYWPSNKEKFFQVAEGINDFDKGFSFRNNSQINTIL